MSKKNPEKHLIYNPYTFMNRLCVDKIPIKGDFYQPRTDLRDAKKIDFQMIAFDKFIVSGSFQIYEEKMKAFFKSLNGSFAYSEKAWVFPISEYKAIVSKLKDNFPDFTINEIPQFVFEALKPLGIVLDVDSAFAVIYDTEDSQKSIQLLPDNILNKLYAFQKKNIQFAIQNMGRILICDEMGLGKTIQSLSIAHCFEQAWPLLIITPSYLKSYWRNEILLWFKQIYTSSQIQIIYKTDQNLDPLAKIHIISYDLCVKYREKLNEKSFQLVICDEISAIKYNKTLKSQVLTVFLQKMKHVILLSSNTQFEKPKEFFTLLSILRPNVFKNFSDFGNRYCDPKPNPWALGIDYNGSCNLQELRFLLSSHYFMRKDKKDVINFLPEKIRYKIPVFIEEKTKIKADEFMNKLSKKSEILEIIENKNSVLYEELKGIHKIIGEAKIKGVKDYIKYILNNGGKTVIYIENNNIIEELENFCKKESISYVRLDEKISKQQFFENCKIFQENLLYKVAIAALETMNELPNFSSISNVIFVEISLKYEEVLQAENKALKLNLKNSINYHYLLGECNLEDILYEEYLNFFDNNFDLDGKKSNFLEFLECHEEEKTDLGIIENLDQIEDLIKEWERERELKNKIQKKDNAAKKEKETLISSDKSPISSEIEVIEWKRGRKEIKDSGIRKKIKKDNNVITIIE